MVSLKHGATVSDTGVGGVEGTRTPSPRTASATHNNATRMRSHAVPAGRTRVGDERTGSGVVVDERFQPLLLQVDGTPGAHPHGMAGIGVVVRGRWGQVLMSRGFCIPARTCTEAEYCAVIAGLELVLRRYPGFQVRCMSDSRVVIEQLKGSCRVRQGSLQRLHGQATALAQQFTHLEFVAIPRALNRLADALAWEALGGRRGIMRFGR